MTHFADAPSPVVPTGAASARSPRALRDTRIAFAARRIDPSAFAGIAAGGRMRPRAGDLVLVRVDRVGETARIDLVCGRSAALFAGDEFIVVYGDHYRPDQFEAYVPGNLSACHLVAAGGVAAIVATSHERAGTPTAITPLGLITDASGAVINLQDFALPMAEPRGALPTVIACTSATGSCDRDRAAAHLVRGLREAGRRVGALRVTGTASGEEAWVLHDAGADVVMDFSDAGLASTFAQESGALEAAWLTLLAHLQHHPLDAIVVDFGSALRLSDTDALVRSSAVAGMVDGVVLSVADVLTASAGVRLVESAGAAVIALTGPMTASPLAMRECTLATRLACLRPDELAQPKRAADLQAALVRSPLGVAA
jgi:hypothetical protein